MWIKASVKTGRPLAGSHKDGNIVILDPQLASQMFYRPSIGVVRRT